VSPKPKSKWKLRQERIAAEQEAFDQEWSRQMFYLRFDRMEAVDPDTGVWYRFVPDGKDFDGVVDNVA
jgi:hypothetical protein